ncbi:tellurite resistance TerB family protein [Woodsholea maritima]|uniref:tellurite resistance TerB family protein n=1 Tax=Woodsholea maritima TaxID=240237 RepID=UPI00036DD2E8|nr:TerB family tellurite resistance protein [Woodsholea maritima]
MFDSLKKFFTGSPVPTPKRPTPQEAAAALLVEAALTDGVYADVEAVQIKALLAKSFELSDDDAQALLAVGEDYAETAVDHFKFTETVKFGLPHDQRLTLLEHLWRVAMADGEHCAYEEAMIRKITPLLGLDDHDSAAARQRARMSKP